MNRFLRSLAQWILCFHRGICLAVAFLSLVAILSLFWTFRMETDVAALLPQKNVAAQQFARIMDLLGHQDTLFVLVEGEREEIIAFAEAFVPKIEHFPKILRVDYKAQQYFYIFFQKMFLEPLLLHFPPEQIEKVLQGLSKEAIQKKIAQNYRKLFSGDPTLATRLSMDPLGFVDKLYTLVQSRPPFDLESGYILAQNQKALLIKIKGKTPATQIYESLALTTFIKETIAPLQMRHPVQVALAGGYQVAAENYYAFRYDLTLTLSTSLLMVLCLVFFVFREKRIFFLIGLPLHVAILWTFALGSFLLSPLTSISLAFAAILVGLGVDFSIHFYNRFLFELTQHPLEEALTQTFLYTGKSILTGGLTTSFGFLVFYTTDFKGFAELGLLSGLGVLICLLVMLVYFPCLLVRAYQKKPFRMIRVGNWQKVGIAFPRFYLFGALLLTLLSLFLLFGYQEKGLTFHSDTQILRPPDTGHFQEKLKEYFQETNVFYVVQHHERLEELFIEIHRLRKHLQEMQQTGLVSHYRSIGDFIPDPDHQKNVLQKLKEIEATQVCATLKQSLEQYGFNTYPVVGGFAFDPNKESYGPYLEWLQKMLTQTTPLSLEDFFADEFQALRESFLLKSGSSYYAVTYLFPGKDIEDRVSRRHFLEQMAKELPPPLEVTGLPVLLYHLEELIISSFYQATWISAFGVLLLAFFHFRSFLALLALLPMILGCLWMFAWMKWFGIPLNFMNIVVIPMIIGLGIDDGIHFMTHYLENQDLLKTLQETGNAITLTSATTLAGYGSLIFAQNLGLVSIGIVALFGIFFCFLNSLFVLPAILSLCGKKEPNGLD